VFGTGDMIFFMRKMTKTPPKINKLFSAPTKKFAHFFVNIFTIFGPWPTFFM